LVRGPIFQMRCLRDHAWIQKNFDIARWDDENAPRPAAGWAKFKIRNSGAEEKLVCLHAIDPPDRTAGGQDCSRLTRKRYSHFFTCGQSSRTFAFKSWHR